MPNGSHPVFAQPADPDISIWRYMEFAKFVSMLSSGKLFLTRADKLGDPFEGSFPKLNTEDSIYRIPDEVAHVPGGKENYLNQLRQLRNYIKEIRAWVFVSCWHMSEHESAGMWKLYARTEEAICIRSKYSALKTLLPPKAELGKVAYVDYDTYAMPIDSLLWPFVHKRKSFEHEREVRAVMAEIHDPAETPRPIPPEGGLSIDTDLNKLIEAVHVAPFAPNWFKETVEHTVRKFGFQFPVYHSKIGEKPLW
jgi:hypothetical protein